MGTTSQIRPSLHARGERVRVRVTLGLRRMVYGGALAGAALVLPLTPSHAYQLSPSDPCLTFLSSGASPGSAEEQGRRSAGTAQAAGKAATVGLLLGVRVALGPAEDLSARNAVKGKARISALDIAHYRTCKKQQALTLSSLE